MVSNPAQGSFLYTLMLSVLVLFCLLLWFVGVKSVLVVSFVRLVWPLLQLARSTQPPANLHTNRDILNHTTIKHPALADQHRVEHSARTPNSYISNSRYSLPPTSPALNMEEDFSSLSLSSTSNPINSNVLSSSHRMSDSLSRRSRRSHSHSHSHPKPAQTAEQIAIAQQFAEIMQQNELLAKENRCA